MKPATLAAALTLALATVAPAGAATDAIAPALVEVQPDPAEDREGEWVEFANPSPTPLDLEGLYLTDHDPCFVAGEGFVETFRWPLNHTVPATSRLVVELPDNCLNLANDGDDLTLEDEDGRQLQSLAYGTEGGLAAPDEAESLSACHAGAHLHGGWETAGATPGAANQDCLPAPT